MELLVWGDQLTLVSLCPLATWYFRAKKSSVGVPLREALTNDPFAQVSQRYSITGVLGTTSPGETVNPNTSFQLV
jgi:hypothetical protein